ncbi:glutamate--tRNA ligase, partial [Candidatus Microgenomates bacterium]
MKQIVRTRIPPSPTGEDLHVGNAYTALINYVFAKKHQGKFIIRIEDTDRTRFVKGAEAQILASLQWLGISYDEGPDISGPFAPYRQSDRLPTYQKLAQELVEKGKAFYCFCSPERLEQMRREQANRKLPPMYDGTCKAISHQQSASRIKKGEKYVVRLNVPDEGTTVVNDLLRGEISFENKLIDDQVILKSDGFPTYHLGVVADDHLMQISHVIRGEEWISSTPKQVLLYNALGWELPVFAHLPVIRNPDKSKLSKRKNPVWVSWFREHGFLPEALLNYLATLAWSYPSGRDIFSLEEMAAVFELTQIQTTAPIFNIEKLSWLNGEYIRALSDQELIDRLQAFMPDVDKKLLTQLAPLAKERMKTLAEFRNYLKPFVDFVPVSLDEKNKELLVYFSSSFAGMKSWTAVELEKIAKEIVTQKNLKIRDAFMALRMAVTGEKVGLPL